MKIQPKKNINNINDESMNSLKDFHQKQITTNIKYHLVFIYLLLVINIGLIVFIMIYKDKINNPIIIIL